MSRRVLRVPQGFDWPLRKRWHGYVMPPELVLGCCPACLVSLDPPRSDGYTPAARALADTFAPPRRGNEPRRGWFDQITQDEVDHLIDHHRLGVQHFYDSVELTEPWETDIDGDPIRFRWVRNQRPNPTAEKVNAAQHHGVFHPMRHDVINEWLLVLYRCAQACVAAECPACGGTGEREVYPGQRADHDAWTRTDPPSGDGWQLWETTSEGSPVGPVLATAEALACWLTTREGGAAVGFGTHDRPMGLEQARAFVGAGAADSFYTNDEGMHDGAAFVAAQRLGRVERG
jgi:hypothetical protein